MNNPHQKNPNFDFYSFSLGTERASGPRLNNTETLPPLSSDTTPISVAAPAVDRGRIRRARRAFSRVGWGFMLLILGGNLASLAVALTVQTFFPALVNTDWYSLLVSSLPLYLAGLGLLSLTTKGLERRAPTPRRIGFGGFCAFLTVSVTAMLVGSILGESTMSLLGRIYHYDFSNMLGTLLESRLWVTVLVSVVLAPFFEELIFRKLLIDRLLPFGEHGAILFSALLFGLMHGNFYQFFYAFLVGAVLALLYLRSGKWGLCVLLHALFNLIGGVLPVIIERYIDTSVLQGMSDPALLMEYLGEHTVGYVMLLSQSFLLYSLAFVGLIVLFACYRKYFKPATIPGELPRGRRLGPALLNVGSLLALLVSVGYFYLYLLSSVLS